MYWKIKKLKWLIRWEFWKRCSLTPKITKIIVWNRGQWTNISIRFKYKKKIYAMPLFCKDVELKYIAEVAPKFYVGFKRTQRIIARGCKLKLGKKLE